MRAWLDSIQLRQFTALPDDITIDVSWWASLLHFLLSLLLASSPMLRSIVPARSQTSKSCILVRAFRVSQVSLIIGRDVAGLEELLRVNAKLPYVESIPIVDVNHRPITSVIKRGEVLMASYDMTLVKPDASGLRRTMSLIRQASVVFFRASSTR